MVFIRNVPFFDNDEYLKQLTFADVRKAIGNRIPLSYMFGKYSHDLNVLK